MIPNDEYYYGADHLRAIRVLMIHDAFHDRKMSIPDVVRAFRIEGGVHEFGKMLDEAKRLMSWRQYLVDLQNADVFGISPNAAMIRVMGGRNSL